MSGGPRDYGVGTERAIFRLAEGTCYFPGCARPIIAVEGEHAIVAVEIAHIRGAKKGSARFDPAMTDAARAAFGNLILLCTTHHKLVDRIEPEKYTAEMLAEWKLSNEPAEGLAALTRQVTEANLESLLEQIVAARGPLRSVEVDLLAGIVVSPEDILSMPIDQWPVALAHNPHLVGLQQVVLANVRNVGAVPVTLEGVDFFFALKIGDVEQEAEASLLGRNDFGRSNPPLPYRLLDGAAVRWFMKVETLTTIADAVAGVSIAALRAQVRLGSGEAISSPRVSWPTGS